MASKGQRQNCCVADRHHAVALRRVRAQPEAVVAVATPLRYQGETTRYVSICVHNCKVSVVAVEQVGVRRVRVSKGRMVEYHPR